MICATQFNFPVTMDGPYTYGKYMHMQCGYGMEQCVCMCMEQCVYVNNVYRTMWVWLSKLLRQWINNSYE